MRREAFNKGDMKLKIFACFLMSILLMGVIRNLHAQNERIPPSLPSYLNENYDETGRPLPPGVPRTVETNGVVIYVPHQFTTRAYRNEAARLVIQQANQVAQELKLPEELPITSSNSDCFINPFGFAFANRMIGTVSTKNYIYYVSRGDKFNGVGDLREEKKCQNYIDQGYAWPTSEIDTNAAYQLATQWLEAVHIDVKALNRECKMRSQVDTAYTWTPSGKFIPVYWISWIPKSGFGDAAAIRLFLPTKTLLDLSVEDPQYILRKPVVFTNLAALFPGKANIVTNYPTPTIYMSAPPRPAMKPALMPNGEVHMVPNN